MDATIFLPNKSQCPIVIFCHGFNGYKDDFREIAEHLLVHEIGSVTITFCGSGARDKSGFATTNMTLLPSVKIYLPQWTMQSPSRNLRENYFYSAEVRAE